MGFDARGTPGESAEAGNAQNPHRSKYCLGKPVTWVITGRVAEIHYCTQGIAYNPPPANLDRAWYEDVGTHRPRDVMSRFRALVKNSAANVASGAANAVLAVVLPPVLIRHLTADEFSTWAVVLQLAAIVNMFGFVVQVAVGRYVARCTIAGDHEFRRQMVSTAFAGMWGATVIALAVVGSMAWLLPTWFPGIPQHGRDEARLALLLIGSSLATGLPATVAAGVFSGFQRNEIPAYVIVASRLAIAAALVFLATAGAGLSAMAGAYAAINVAATLIQLALLKQQHPDLGFRRTAVTMRAGRELAGYCFSLTVWSISILAVNGLDSVIAGRIDFHWAGYFAVVGSVVTLALGVQVAVLQPLVAIAAQLHSRHESRRLGELLIEATRANAALSLLCLVPIYIAGGPLLGWWIGSALGAQILPILQVVLLGIFLRQTVAPFAAILLGTGEQRLVIATPIYEGVAKLAVSIALGIWIGPIGIALGTVVGGVVCLATNLLRNFPRVRGLDIDRRRFVLSGAIRPTVVFAPVLLVAVADALLAEPTPLSLRIIAALLTSAGALALGWPALRRLRALV